MNSFGRLRRLCETVRWLKPGQVGWRLWRRLWRPRPSLAPAPDVRESPAGWQRCRRRASLIGPMQLSLLGAIRTIAAPGDWDREDWPRLWRYNLHYFNDLNAEGAAARAAWHQDLISDWLRSNPPVRGVGWEPYPTSLRLVNWIQHAFSGGRLPPGAVQSLAVQARWLRSRLEYHLLGNHLLANAKALLFCSGFFEGREADAWRRKALSLLRRELAEQVLADGGHFERSPMYHAIVLEDLLDLCQLAALRPGLVPEAQSRAWRDLACRMLGWLRVMTHPDGRIAFFNDAAFGVAPEPGDLAAYAEALGVVAAPRDLLAVELLPESGFVRLQRGQAVLLADVGSVGPDYLPGHAHAGTLSFELSIAGRRCIVNSGTSTYEPGRERDRQRGTAVHSTVTVEGRDSSEVWAGFRVARRARVVSLAARVEGDALIVEAAHDGYARQGVSGLHRRCWRLASDRLEIRDEVEGGAAAIARLHLHPDFRPSEGSLAGPDGEELRLEATAGATPEWRAGTWHPEFGGSQPNWRVELPFHGRATLAIAWAGRARGGSLPHNPPAADAA